MAKREIDRTRRLVIGMTGASGAILGIRMLEILQSTDVESHLVLSPSARRTIVEETDRTIEDVQALADVGYKHGDIGAAIASGSFGTLGMVIIPCSIKTLSGIANCYADDLITRAADVTLKEGRPLILAVRETPLHRGHVRQMAAAADAGAILYPPVPAFYARPQSVNELVDHTVGRILARIGIDNQVYVEWSGTNRTTT